MQKFHTDLVIIGGGISGLWLFRRLCDLGARVVLLESEALGAGQTLASQGMIHGGQRYTLQGSISKQALAVAAMPAIWAGCLRGDGILDLSAAKHLSEFQLMWSSGGLSSKVVAFFASKVMQAQMTALAREQWPDVFRNDAYQGSVYRMDEVVLDIASVLRALIGKDSAQIYRARITDYLAGATGLRAIVLEDEYELSAKHFIFTAGKGNEEVVAALNIKEPTTQRRPLKQVLVKGDLPRLYGHCIAADNQPRFTVSTHPLGNEQVWYLGGKISEQGVGKDDEAIIRAAYAELADVFPWIDWRNKQWATLPIDRAEPFHPKGLRQEEPVIKRVGNTYLAWPTKLTLAPALAERILEQLQYTAGKEEQIHLPLTRPAIGRYPWEEARWINTP